MRNRVRFGTHIYDDGFVVDPNHAPHPDMKSGVQMTTKARVYTGNICESCGIQSKTLVCGDCNKCFDEEDCQWRAERWENSPNISAVTYAKRRKKGF